LLGLDTRTLEKKTVSSVVYLNLLHGRNVKDSHLGHKHREKKCVSMGYKAGNDGVGSAGFNDLLANKMLQWPIVVFAKLEKGCNKMLRWMNLVLNVEHGNGLECDCVCFVGSWVQGGDGVRFSKGFIADFDGWECTVWIAGWSSIKFNCGQWSREDCYCSSINRDRLGEQRFIGSENRCVWHGHLHNHFACNSQLVHVGRELLEFFLKCIKFADVTVKVWMSEG